MAYCTFCSRLIEDIITPLLDADYKRWELEKDRDFKVSLQQCALCKFLYQCLQELFGDHISKLDEEGKLRKMCVFNRYGRRYRNGGLDRPLCRFELHFPSLGNRSMADFAIWADMGKCLYLCRWVDDSQWENLHELMIKY